jgi:hypothetical protein
LKFSIDLFEKWTKINVQKNLAEMNLVFILQRMGSGVLIIPLLHLFSFNLPIKWADLSEKATLHCAFSMRNGVKPSKYRCKLLCPMNYIIIIRVVVI